MVTTRLRDLMESDEPAISPWLEAYLREHLGWWSSSVYGSPWSEEKITEHLHNHDLVAEEWRNLMRAADASDSLVQIAHDSRSPSGVVWGEIRTDRYLRVPMGVISWLYVEPDSRRQGIAALLLEAAHGWFQWQGVPGRTLHVTKNNVGACAVYAKAGYEIADHRLLAGPVPPPSEESP